MAYNPTQFRTLIVNILVEEGLYSPRASNLLMGTCAVESRFGTYLRQVGGPALSPFQIERSTFEWLKGKYAGFHPYIDKTFEALEWDLKLAIIMCRLRYTAVKEPIPATLQEQAEYWKKYYNTRLGAGTPEKFIEAYRRYCV